MRRNPRGESEPARPLRHTKTYVAAIGGRLNEMRIAGYALTLVTCAACLACERSPDIPTLTLSASALGAEADVVGRQLARFSSRNGVRAEIRVTPDAADQRHQLYVQWLAGRASEPDVLQLDIIWTAEFAAAGWIAALDRFAPPVDDFFPAAITADRWRGSLYALPWFVDVGLLYWRTDLMDAAPRSLSAVREIARRGVATRAARFGLVWQGARYEGLVTVFLEHLGAFGGRILDDEGRVVVDQPPAIRALTFMRDAVGRDGFVPDSALTWQEEQTRFVFQNAQAVFMRNWPYAWLLLQDRASAVAGRVGVTAFPASDGGRPTASLGGSQLAINAYSAHPDLAWQLAAYLTEPAQMLERATAATQLPARRSVYTMPALARALPLPVSDIYPIIEAAVPRPVTPVYSELSEILQVQLHRALTRQTDPSRALGDAASQIRELLARAGLAPRPASAAP